MDRYERNRLRRLPPSEQQNVSVSESTVRCFLSHKCTYVGEAHHKFGHCFRKVLESHGVELLIDPFGPGMEVGARIHTVEFHALVFLSCRETNNSPWCKEELATARRHLVPVFVIRWSEYERPAFSHA